MITQKIGIIDGKAYTFCQCETIEEAKKLNLPPNVYSFWKHGDEVLLAPGQLLDKIQDSISKDTFVPQQLVKPSAVEKYYHKLLEHQNNIVIEYAMEQVEQAKKHPNAKEFTKYIKDMEELIDNHKNKVFDFDPDGVLRADTKKAKKILGDTVYNQMFPEGSQFLDAQKL